MFFVNKCVATNYFLEVIKENSQNPPRWNRILDIGTGPAIHPRLLKGMGLCEEAWGIDLLDRSQDYSDDQFMRCVEQIKMVVLSGNDIEREMVKGVIEDIGNILGKEHPFYLPFLFRSKETISIDKYLVQDFIQWEPGALTFDLITGFGCIEYFDVQAFFQKVSRLLEPGGTLFFFVDNWYDVWGSAMHIPMDAPWLHARVRRDDLMRYYKEMRPDILCSIEKCVYFASSHITPVDYIDAAKKVGLKHLGYQRSFLKNCNSFFMIDRNTEYFYDQVLPQSKEINPNVTVPDFFMPYLTMTFVKE